MVGAGLSSAPLLKLCAASYVLCSLALVEMLVATGKSRGGRRRISSRDIAGPIDRELGALEGRIG